MAEFEHQQFGVFGVWTPPRGLFFKVHQQLELEHQQFICQFGIADLRYTWGMMA